MPWRNPSSFPVSHIVFKRNSIWLKKNPSNNCLRIYAQNSPPAERIVPLYPVMNCCTWLKARTEAPGILVLLPMEPCCQRARPAGGAGAPPPSPTWAKTGRPGWPAAASRVASEGMGAKRPVCAPSTALDSCPVPTAGDGCPHSQVRPREAENEFQQDCSFPLP